MVALLVFGVGLVNNEGAQAGQPPTAVSLQLQHLLITPPLDAQLSQLQSVDLPLLSWVAVGSTNDVQLLPYVGGIELVGPGDNNNANILETQSGFVIRGLVSLLFK